MGKLSNAFLTAIIDEGDSGQGKTAFFKFKLSRFTSFLKDYCTKYSLTIL